MHCIPHPLATFCICIHTFFCVRNPAAQLHQSMNLPIYPAYYPLLVPPFKPSSHLLTNLSCISP
jgi:hypothetical protein